jgi:hypothetical protein
MGISSMRTQKLLVMSVIVILSYYLFNLPMVQGLFSQFYEMGYIVAAISGMFFAFGFTMPFAIASLILLNPSNLALATFLALAGCMTSNFFIYHFFNDQFMSEFDMSKRNPILRRFDVEMKKGMLDRMKIYLSCTFVGIMMCLPISEETETLILTGFKEIDTSKFILLGILLNSIMIFLLILA